MQQRKAHRKYHGHLENSSAVRLSTPSLISRVESHRATPIFHNKASGEIDSSFLLFIWGMSWEGNGLSLED